MVESISAASLTCLHIVNGSKLIEIQRGKNCEVSPVAYRKGDANTVYRIDAGKKSKMINPAISQPFHLQTINVCIYDSNKKNRS